MENHEVEFNGKRVHLQRMLLLHIKTILIFVSLTNSMSISVTSVNTQSRSQFRHWELWAVALVLILLFSGFLFNRVVSNVGMFLAGIYALTQSRRWSWIFREPTMWIILAVCIIPLVSDLWTQEQDFYRHRGVMKWILVLFPCFVFALPAGRSAIRLVHVIFLVSMALSTTYSLWHYVADFSSMAARYKMSKVMPTLAFGDHIRIGWLTVVSCVVAWFEVKSTQFRALKWSLLVYIVFQVVFLHLLGAKTGLITLYLSTVILAVFELPGGRKWLITAIGLLVLLMPVVSYYTIPSLRERFHFIKYDFEHYIRGEYREGLSDAVRLYSLQAGYEAVRQNPYMGTGFSRLQEFCNSWYKENVPDLKADNYFLPSSEIMIYWASGGLIALAAILAYLFFPLVVPLLRTSSWWLTFYLPASLTLLYETHLEGQLPLFAWSFCFAWFWKLAKNDGLELGFLEKLNK